MARELDRLQGIDAPMRVRAQAVVRSLRPRARDMLTDWAEVLTDRPRLQRLVDEGGARAGEVDAMVRWTTRQQDVSDDDGGIATIDGRPMDEDDPGGRFDIEDDPILLRLAQLKCGGLMARDSTISYSHVAIDEAQDRSAIEVKVLLDSVNTISDDAEPSVTIAGDTAQRLVFDNNFSGWQDLLEQTGHAAAVVRPLKLSYRSTAEVMVLARAILGPLAPEEQLAARSGAPVEHHAFSDIGEAVAFLADSLRGLTAREPTASVAIVSRYPEQADAYYSGLTRAEVASLRRVRSHEFSFDPGIDVTDVSQVKGLEFDYAIMVDVNAASYPDHVEARHLLHIGVTRAAHQLWLVSTDKPSPLIPESMR
jgi:DNA helicase-2/ATP-dependent DNA helicase PcrA